MSQIPPTAASLRGAVDLSSLLNRPAQGSEAPISADGRGVSVPSLVLDGTDTTFTQILELSNAVPVIVVLWAKWSNDSQQLVPLLQKLVLEYDGRLVLVRVDVDANPQLAQAFQADALPTVAAILAGRPVGLFAGIQPEATIRRVLEQIVHLAAENGVTGTATPADGGAATTADEAEETETPLPPHHAEAFDAISRGDYAAAIAEYEKAMAENPRDQLAVAGLAQVKLLSRLDGKAIDDIRTAAATDPKNVEAQLLVADLDVSGGHIDDAFARLLQLYPNLDQSGQESFRTRLLELFEVVGSEDPRVVAARRQLAMLLY